MARRANNSVLLVDDDADSREALSWLLNERGVSTGQAGNEHAQTVANHESPRTTKLYDRTREALSAEEIQRIRI